MERRVCIFCGANSGNSNKVINQTILLCDLLIRSGYNLVYGGGGMGLMGIIAERFLENGAKVIGVRPSLLIKNEETHTDVTELIVVETMQERKAKLIELSDLFIALPGGVGTLDEIIETFTLLKIGFTTKQSGILNTDGFYDNLVFQLKKMSKWGFLQEADRTKLQVAEDPRRLIELMNIKELNRRPETEIDKIAFIDIRNGKILVSKSKGKDKYYIPGGKRELNESDEETLIREVNEELSVNIDPHSIKYFGIYVAQADGKQQGVDVRMTCYEAKYLDELAASNEIEEIDWFDYSKIDLVAEVDKIIFNDLKHNGRLN